MFYSQEILTSKKKGGFGVIWLAATLGPKTLGSKKLSKKDYLGVNVNQACEFLIDPPEPMALRLTGNLMLGLTRVYSQQYTYYYQDVQTLWQQVHLMNAAKQFEGKSVSMEKINLTTPTTRKDAITIREGKLDIPIGVIFGEKDLFGATEKDASFVMAPIQDWNIGFLAPADADDSFWIPASASGLVGGRDQLVPTSAEKARNQSRSSKQVSPFPGGVGGSSSHGSVGMILSSESSTPYPHSRGEFLPDFPTPLEQFLEFDNIPFPDMEFDDGYVPVGNPFLDVSDQGALLPTNIKNDQNITDAERIPKAKRQMRNTNLIDDEAYIKITQEEIKYNTENYVKEMIESKGRILERKRLRESIESAEAQMTALLASGKPFGHNEMEKIVLSAVQQSLKKRFKRTPENEDKLEFDNTFRVVLEGEEGINPNDQNPTFFDDFFDDGGGNFDTNYSNSMGNGTEADFSGKESSESAKYAPLPWEEGGINVHDSASFGSSTPRHSLIASTMISSKEKPVKKSPTNTTIGNTTIGNTTIGNLSSITGFNRKMDEVGRFLDWLSGCLQMKCLESGEPSKITKTISFNQDLVSSANNGDKSLRKVAASAFYNILVLATEEKVSVRQESTFGNISITLYD